MVLDVAGSTPVTHPINNAVPSEFCYFAEVVGTAFLCNLKLAEVLWLPK